MLPHTIYVQENAPEGSDCHYYMAHDTKQDVCDASLDEGEAGECVGVYELVKTVKLARRVSFIQTDISEVTAT